MLILGVFQFVFEGMEESGSEGLEELITAEKDAFLKVIEGVVRRLLEVLFVEIRGLLLMVERSCLGSSVTHSACCYWSS